MILAINKGKVEEVGTHADLMDAKGLYHNLVTAQFFEDATSSDVPARDVSVAKDLGKYSIRHPDWLGPG